MQQPTMMHDPGVNADTPRERLTAHLSEVSRLGSLRNALYCEALASHLGVTPAEQKCLTLLIENDEHSSTPMTPRQVAREINLTPGAVTGVLSRLESAGFIERKNDVKDRRRVLILLNHAEIEAAVRPFDQRWQQAMQKLADRYSERELRSITDFMERWTELIKTQTTALRGPVGALPDPA